MKISGCEIFLVALPNRRHHTWASKMTAPIGRHAVVRVDTDEGLSGWGEAPAGISWGGPHGRYCGESPETVRHVIAEHLIEAVKGLDPRDIAVIHSAMDKAVKGNPYAKAALDMASYDIAGKAAGVPVHRLLGGQFRDRIEVAHSLGIMPVEKCVDEAVMARVTQRQEEYNILLCEQPLMDNRQLAFVAERIGCPVMADESAWTVHDILELHELKAASCFSCYVTKPGGLHRAKQQADIAAALGMYSDIGGSIESGIGNAANLHLGAASERAILPSVSPVSKPEGASGPSVAGVYYLDDLIAEPFRFEDGCVLVPDGPGLGIEVDTDKLEKYAAP